MLVYKKILKVVLYPVASCVLVLDCREEKKKEKTIKLALAMALGRRSSGAFAGLDPHSACFVAAGRGRPEGTSGRPCEASEAGQK